MADKGNGFEVEAARVRRRWEQLKGERASWDGHFKELARQMLPRRGRFSGGERNDGRRMHQAIVNNTPLLAARNLAAGLTSGLTSPARPWFTLSVSDPQLNASGPVKRWLENVGAIMAEVMGRSNIYNALATAYGELGVFGTAAIAVVEDGEDGIRAYCFTAGEYVIALSERETVETFMRETVMTTGQVAGRFGRSACSLRVRNLLDRGEIDAPVTILHAVEPNFALDPDSAGVSGKRFISRYLELGSDAPGFLSVGGFNEMPVLAPRWSVSSMDVYGSSPGMDALGDALALQTLEKKRAQALEKLINPPMVADPALRNQPATVLPGGVTYAPSTGARPAFSPAYQIAPPLGEIRHEIAAHEERIRRAFFEDLFLMLALSDRRQITAREVEERHEEKLLMLGPVLERLHEELLDPLIDRVFSILHRAGWLPPAPQELSGRELRVEYTSVLAQAQKASAVGALEAFSGFVGRVSQLSPSAVDAVDWDRLVAKDAEAVGISPTILRDAAEVAAIRASRAKAFEAQAAGR